MTAPRSDLLSPGEAALILRKSPRTVVRWAELGVFPTALITDGGHRRFHRADIEQLRDEMIAELAS